jgi:hypothetical protein
MPEDQKKNEKGETKLPVMDTKTTNDMLVTAKGEEGRVYRFSMPFHSPLPECYHAAINIANEIARLFNEAVKKQEEANKKEEEGKD